MLASGSFGFLLCVTAASWSSSRQEASVTDGTISMQASGIGTLGSWAVLL